MLSFPNTKELHGKGELLSGISKEGKVILWSTHHIKQRKKYLLTPSILCDVRGTRGKLALRRKLRRFAMTFLVINHSSIHWVAPGHEALQGKNSFQSLFYNHQIKQKNRITVFISFLLSHPSTPYYLSSQYTFETILTKDFPTNIANSLFCNTWCLRSRHYRAHSYGNVPLSRLLKIFFKGFLYF